MASNVGLAYFPQEVEVDRIEDDPRLRSKPTYRGQVGGGDIDSRKYHKVVFTAVLAQVVGD